jgi:hypothetical protein
VTLLSTKSLGPFSLSLRNQEVSTNVRLPKPVTDGNVFDIDMADKGRAAKVRRRAVLFINFL